MDCEAEHLLQFAVMGSVLAMIVALHLGFRATMLAGLLGYAGAWGTVWWLGRGAGGEGRSWTF